MVNKIKVESSINAVYINTFWAWTGQYKYLSHTSGTVFGFVRTGAAEIITKTRSYFAYEGHSFCVNHPCSIETKIGFNGFVVCEHNSKGLLNIVGELEDEGRLKYVSGCSDTVLIHPPKKGAPCLNGLWFPPHTKQVIHYHPSDRFGMVARGDGLAITEDEQIKLKPGDVFNIPPNLNHAFYTGDNPLTIVAYHPETDFGCTDEDHPMINGTNVLL